MGSKMGYEYLYRFSMVDEDEIPSLCGLLDKLKLKPGVKPFLFHIKTNFILKKRTEEGAAESVIIDSESFDAPIFAHGDENKDAMRLCVTAYSRLTEYWMTPDEIKSFAHEAFAFALQIADDPRHAPLNLVPVVVYLDVCTVQQQQEGESVGDRAITAGKLLPLYLWPMRTERMAAELDKPMTPMLKNFLRGIERIRVEDVDEGLALMPACHLCERKPTVGAQISLLSTCNHAFHSRCIVGWLEENNLCPLCCVPAYGAYVAQPPKRLRVPLVDPPSKRLSVSGV